MVLLNVLIRKDDRLKRYFLSLHIFEFVKKVVTRVIRYNLLKIVISRNQLQLHTKLQSSSMSSFFNLFQNNNLKKKFKLKQSPATEHI